MKNTVLFIAISALILTSCNSSPKSGQNQGSSSDTVINRPTDTTSASDNNASVSVTGIVDKYLKLKNALAEDNSYDAANAGKSLEVTFFRFNKSLLSESQRKTFEEISETIKQDAEHIFQSGSNIDHQREHFEMISQDIYDLVKTFNHDQVLYQFFCPMYNKGKGASWLNDSKDIKTNPYMGKSMATCGTLKEEIK